MMSDEIFHVYLFLIFLLFISIIYSSESKGIDNLGFAEINVEPADDLRQQFEVNARPRLDGVHLSVATDDTVSVSVGIFLFSGLYPFIICLTN